MTLPPDPIRRAADLIRAAKRALAFTGAGLSTPSGIPDFRSPGTGLWNNDDPMEVATLTAFRHHPERFFNWVRPLAATACRAQPNAAHLALVRMEAAGQLMGVITQNIDDLHHRAGAQTVYEVHGSLNTATCRECHRTVPGARVLRQFVDDGLMPTCAHCGGILKPDVVLFEEQLPQAVFHAAQLAARQCDLMLVVGSSLEVMPSARLPHEAVARGARLIIINHSRTYLDDTADVVLHANCAEVLPRIVDAL